MSRVRRSLLFPLVALLLSAPLPAHAQQLPFRDPDLPRASRIADLLGRLTVDEKVSLLHQYQPAIPRLGIGAFKTGTEALHGVAWLGEATVFPQAIGLATTWDPELVEQVGAVTGREARGFHARNPAFNGLNLWAPVVNLLRDPRWGRNEEGYSEDPHLTGAISTAFGHGVQGDHPEYLQAAPTLKHYAAYNVEDDRIVVDSIVPPRILKDYDEAAFKPAIQADAATGVMASYNLLNGRPTHVNHDLDDVVRSWTDEDLMIVGDASGASNIAGAQRYYPNEVEGNAAAIRAGLDNFTEDNDNSAPTTGSIKAALDRGLITMADVDDAARHVLSIRFRLGEFDPAGRNPYAGITPDVIDAPAHRQLARKAAAEQVVLLRNDDKTLPLSTEDTKKVAVVGQLADTLYEDWYSGTMPYRVTPVKALAERAAVTSSEGVDRIRLKDLATGKYVTASAADAGAPLTATAATPSDEGGLDVFDWGEGTVTLRSVANGKTVSLGDGRALVNNAVQPNGWFVQQQFKVVAQADGSVVLEYAGNEVTQSWFGPNKYVVVGADGRLTLGAATPRDAAKFGREIVRSGVDSAVEAAKGADAAVVVVGSMPFINGREDDDRKTTELPAGQRAVIDAVRAANPNTIVVLESSYPYSGDWDTADLPAILWTSHAGQETGHGIADVLFGDHNPSARLTQTWYRSDADLPDKLQYDISKSGHTYQYFRGKPLYPFGHGLSYTSFRYSKLAVDRSLVHASGEVKVRVDVTNTGDRAGAEVVQLYSHQKKSRVQQPVKQLRAFDRVELRPGETKTVRFTVPVSELSFWDVTRDKRVVETAPHDFTVGSLTRTVHVLGEQIPPRDLRKVTPAQNFDDYSGVTLVDTTRERGTAVASTAPGQWIAFKDVNLGPSSRSVKARVANPGAPTTVEVRLGGPTGRLVGTLAVPTTADKYSWTEVSSPLRGASGRQDVYLVFTGKARIDNLTVEGSS
ncbi:glycoside hydrolase family 3 C-terminal domain-containing protein [Saccharothrix sp. S26]|uniref:glycoside hydrolase family 3 protein n=1 Tax=Saccharothrix sp. S26 TaxID=2907215 RepID=UPI001F3F98FA|nr:glycoside hydrolase family 3 protein [Saccharothrix sp. S26]MCE6998214.1 glycoside hydrolase family 3 C-terminal domain-containing protein [Saccharothrix sp. S26]